MIVLYWLAVICLILFALLMGGVLLAIAHHIIRDAHKRRHYASVPPAPDRHTCTQDDVDRLAAEYRDSQLGHQNLAWPPGTTAPPRHLPQPPQDGELDAWAAEWEARYQL